MRAEDFHTSSDYPLTFHGSLETMEAELYFIKLSLTAERRPLSYQTSASIYLWPSCLWLPRFALVMSTLPAGSFEFLPVLFLCFPIAHVSMNMKYFSPYDLFYLVWPSSVPLITKRQDLTFQIKPWTSIPLRIYTTCFPTYPEAGTWAVSIPWRLKWIPVQILKMSVLGLER